ncbi:LPXTG cell wall anchor domain-containing protein [Nocardioides sp. JQ2195]|uniref:LPXTG cell wall anchor domain-containing protein n=1 Tax=Nocardioides sp. JQ2195 TaxID=2592334 RepID=UPI00143EDF68|nr:LPXTG cell wall anchor domain-containing protein [Nocardioides sp. JQ2195]QIX25401.1 LPXTG cell wall anchor domain-containing protein [Nocardioides sp. JQ2195]
MHSAYRRASSFRQLLARMAAVLLISLAAVAGLAGPAAADGEWSPPDGTTSASPSAPADDAVPAPDTPAEPETQAPTSAEPAAEPAEEPAEEAPTPEEPKAAEPKAGEPADEQPTPETKPAPAKSTSTTEAALAPTTDGPESKVWICKYSSTPEDNEKAQTVNSVAYNSNRIPGTWGFEDAQGLTYVYSFDTGQASKPSKDDCPVLIDPPAPPTWTEPTCADPLGSYQLPAYPADRATVSTSGSLEPGGTFTVTWTAVSPYRFLNGSGAPTETISFSHTFSQLSSCPVVIDDLPTVQVSDPCGTADDSVTLSHSSQYTGVDNGDGTATFTAVPPNVFPGNEATYTVTYVPTTDVPCIVTVDLAAPTITPSTACDTPWSIAIGDTDHVSYAISPAASGTEATTVTITATPDVFFAFSPAPGWTIHPDGTATFEHSFAAATTCLDVPAEPIVTAPTCYDDGYLTVEIRDHATVTVNGTTITSATMFGPGSYDVVYTADAGHVFDDAGTESTTTTYDDIVVEAATGDCVIDVPAQPDSTDTCNPDVVVDNVEWAPFPTLDNIVWSVDASTGEAIATAINGMSFSNGVTEKRYSLPADNGIKCAAPVDPVVTQSSACDVQGTLTVPDTEGITYALDGDTIAPGTHDGPLSGTLTATALPGYEDTDADWSFHVDIAAATTCLDVPAEPAPTPPTCFDDGTLTVTPAAHATVTVNGDPIVDETVYGPGSYDVVYTADAGHVFDDAGTESTTTTYDDIVVEAATGDCVIALEAEPTEIDPCNTDATSDNIRWADFPVQDDIEWSVDPSTGEAVATATNGMFFGPGVTEQRFAPSPDAGLDCSLLPGSISSVCVGDIPYLSYAMTLPDDYVGPTDMTITFVNPDGRDYVVTGQPLAGELLWPGASVDPAGWPGWVRNPDGTYSETTGNYAWTREGVEVRFQVNPEFTTTVAYPQATSACAGPAPADDPGEGPEEGPKPQAKPSTPDAILPNTGAPSGSGMYAVLGGLYLTFGAWLMFRNRRRRA